MSHFIDQQAYEDWINEVEQPRLQRRVTAIGAAAYDQDWPLITIIMPCFNTPPGFLRAAVESVLSQIYPRWELLLVDDASTSEDVAAQLREFGRREPRIRALMRPTNGGIAVATNDALAESQGNYVAFLDHDDALVPQALLLVARFLKEHPELRLLYSDSDHIDADGVRHNPFFKPDFNYELLLGQNFFNHLSVYHSALLRNLGGLRTGFDGSQDYDLALRAVERLSPDQVGHMPEVLYHWRVHSQSAARSNMGQAVARAREALRQHLGRTGQPGTAESPRLAKIHNRVDWSLAAGASDWQIVDCEAARDGAELNAQLESSHASHILFLPGGFKAINADSLATLAGLLARPQAGAAAATLLAPDGRLVQGPVFSPGEPVSALVGAADDDRGYFARLDLDQRVTVASLSGLAIQRQVLDNLGGLDPYLRHPLMLGCDLALRLRQLEKFTVWSPQARFAAGDEQQALAATLPAFTEDLESLMGRWGRELGRDPYYNENFARGRADFSLN
ncbi:MAG: glycosyltransferase [Pseudomonadota bacterium]